MDVGTLGLLLTLRAFGAIGWRTAHKRSRPAGAPRFVFLLLGALVGPHLIIDLLTDSFTVRSGPAQVSRSRDSCAGASGLPTQPSGRHPFRRLGRTRLSYIEAAGAADATGVSAAFRPA